MSGKISDDRIGKYYSEETYSKGLSREDTIEQQVRLIASFYSNSRWDEFEYGLKILIALLPQLIREKIRILSHDTTHIGVEKHYQQFLDIQKIIETDTNMIFKKRFIKTYE